MHEKPVIIGVTKAGQHWAVYAEEELVTQSVYEKGALTFEGVLRGLLRCTKRKLSRLALSEAMQGPKPKPAEPAKAQCLSEIQASLCPVGASWK